MTPIEMERVCATLMELAGNRSGPNAPLLARAQGLLGRIERDGASTTRLRAKALLVRQAFDVLFGAGGWIADDEAAETRRALESDIGQLYRACRDAHGADTYPS